MTYREKFYRSSVWHEKVTVIELYHLKMCAQGKWNISDTAKYFDVSLGLVSENLKLAQAIHKDTHILNCKSRQDALRYVNGSRQSERVVAETSEAKLSGVQFITSSKITIKDDELLS